MAAQMFTAKEIATDLHIDPKALRKFIREYERAHEDENPFGLENLPGQGGRYSFAPEEADSLKAAYLENAAKRARKVAKEVAPIEAEDLDTDAEDLEFEDLNGDGEDIVENLNDDAVEAVLEVDEVDEVEG